jgi:hypothetical protein
MMRRSCGLLFVAFILPLAFGRNAAAQDQHPIAADEATTNSEQNAPFRQRDWFGPWQFGLSFTGTGGIGTKQFMYGGGLGVSLRHVSEFNARPIVSLNEDFGAVIAIMTMGITAAPRGMWMGNEWGFDIRARLLESRGKNSPPEQRLALGIAPSFRITRAGSRLRFPAFLPTFVPEMGIGLVQGRAPEVIVNFHPFSMGFLISDHVALEIEASAMLAIPTDQNKTEVWALQSLSLELR